MKFYSKYTLRNGLKQNKSFNLKTMELDIKKNVNIQFLQKHSPFKTKINSILNPKSLTKEQKIQVIKFKTKFKIKIWNKFQNIKSFIHLLPKDKIVATPVDLKKKLGWYNKIKQFNVNDLKKKTITDKINSHSMVNGNKQTNEKNFLKSLKLLQKKTNKQTNELIKLALLSSTSTFKVHKIEKKRKKKDSYIKEIPKYLGSSSIRTSLAIKFIISICKQKKLPTFAECFCEEILLHVKGKGEGIKKKDDLIEKVTNNKKYEKYTQSYRWK